MANKTDLDLNLKFLLNTNGTMLLSGTFFVFKKHISDQSTILKQAIKQLSQYRITGKNIPDTICVIDQNKKLAYLYYSKTFLAQIEQVYVGINQVPSNFKLTTPQIIDLTKNLSFLIDYVNRLC